MCARRVGPEGTPVGGWSSAPPPVVSGRQRWADAKVRVIAAIIIGLIVFGIVHLMDMPRTNPEDTVRQYLTYLADGDAECCRRPTPASSSNRLRASAAGGARARARRCGRR